MISLRSNYGWYCNFDFPRAPNRTMSHFFPPFGDWPKSLLEPNYWHQNQSTIVKLQARFGSNNPQIAKQKIEPLGLVNLIDPLLITFTRWELFSKRLCYIEMILLYLFSLSDCTWCAARACLFRDHIRLRDRNLLLLRIASRNNFPTKLYLTLVVDSILFSSIFSFFPKSKIV